MSGTDLDRRIERNEWEYKPIDNSRVEELTEAVIDGAPDKDSRLEEFVRQELYPHAGTLADERVEVKLIAASLDYLLGIHAPTSNRETWRRRRIGGKLETTHQIDTARALLRYDVDNDVDYKDIIIGLLHDLIEDTILRGGDIRICLRETIKTLDLSDDDKYLCRRGLGDIMDGVVRSTRVKVTRAKKERYDAYLRRVYERGNSKLRRNKIADKIAQSYEMDERGYYTWVGRRKDELKHKIVGIAGEERIQRLREASVSERFFAKRVLLPAYNWLEHLDITGYQICEAAYKGFINIDFCCRSIRDDPSDAALIALKDDLVDSVLTRVIGARKQHLIEGHHVSQERADEIEKSVREEYEATEELYRRTDGGLIDNYYSPAMAGDREMMRTLDQNKEEQFRHLTVFEFLLKNKYLADRGKTEDIFIFDWNEDSTHQ